MILVGGLVVAFCVLAGRPLGVLAGLVLLAAGIVARTVREYGGGRLAWRWLTGHHLDGHYRTNRGWFVRGTKVMHRSGRASAYAHAPRLAVAAARWGVSAAAVGAVAGWVKVRPVAVVAIPVILALVTAYGAWRGTRRALAITHRRRTVKPLAAALALPLESTPAEVSRTLAVPRKIGQDAQVTAALPAHWQGTAGQTDAVARIVGQRLGHEWGTRVVRSPALALVAYRRPEPPGRVTFAQVADLIRAEGGPARILMGLGVGNEPVWLDFGNELAHLGVSAGPGAGKSSFLRLVLAQFAYWGAADFPCLDAKGTGLAGLDVPGLVIHRETRAQWAAVAECREDMEARYTALVATPGLSFPLRVLLADELNDSAITWRAEWRDMRERGEVPARSPATPPVYSDLTRVMVKGRESGYRVIGCYQRLTAAACGGMDAGTMRDAYGLKALARFGPQAWDSLTGIRPRAASSTVPGRWALVSGQDVRQVQVAHGEAAELVAFARSGQAHRAAWANVPPVRVNDSPAGGEGGTGTPAAPEREAVVIGLADAAARLRMSPEGFRKARQRRPIGGEFRTADGRPGWTLDALLAWRPADAEGAA